MNAFLNESVRYVAAQSWQIVVLAIVLAAVTFALRRRSAHTRYLLWLIVVAKCLVPPVQVVPLQVLPPGPSVEILSTGVLEPMLIREPPVSTTSEPSSIPVPPVQVSPLPAPGEPVATARHLSATERLGIIWVAGVGVYLMTNLLRALRGHYRLRKTRTPLPAEVQADAAELFSAYGVRHLPRIWITPSAGQPFVWGALRGDIYVPPGFLAIASPEHRRNILAHELSHVLRFDAAVNALQTIAQGLFWFHPFVWWANQKIRREREKCCDEMVIARLRTKPKDYSTALVEALARAAKSSRPVPSLAVAGPLRHIEERIRTILAPGKRFYARPGLTIVATVLVAAAILVPTAIMLTTAAPSEDTEFAAEGETADSGAPDQSQPVVRDINEVLAKYKAARDTVPNRYRMIISDFGMKVAYQDGNRFYEAYYSFSPPRQAGHIQEWSDGGKITAREQAKAGSTFSSMLAWANHRTPQDVEAYDGVRWGAGLHEDGFGHLEGRKAEVSSWWPGPDHLSALQELGWPEISLSDFAPVLIPDDPYALRNGLVCIETQSRCTTQTGTHREESIRTERFYLNPAKSYICQRRSDGDRRISQVTKYSKTSRDGWYPLEIRDFHTYVRGRISAADEPVNVTRVLLDTNPAFPKNIFSPDLLMARYASQIVLTPDAKPPVQHLQPDASQKRLAGRVLAGDTHQPIADALIRVGVPGIDMRYTRVGSKQITQDDGTISNIYETRTDPNGCFEILVPAREDNKTFAVDALAPGYGTAAENYPFNADLTVLDLFPEPTAGFPFPDIANLTILLPRTIYVAGIVKNAQGNPVERVSIDGVMQLGRARYSVAKTETDEHGRFAVFDFPLRGERGDTGTLTFIPPFGTPVTVGDLYEMNAQERASLKVTVP